MQPSNFRARKLYSGLFPSAQKRRKPLPVAVLRLIHTAAAAQISAAIAHVHAIVKIAAAAAARGARTIAISACSRLFLLAGTKQFDYTVGA